MKNVYLLVALLFGCISPTIPTPPNPEPQPIPVPIPSYDDGSLGDVFQTECQKACSTLVILGCPEGYAQPIGDSCEMTCEHIMETTIIVFDPKCVYSSSSQVEVRSCPAIECTE